MGQEEIKEVLEKNNKWMSSSEIAKSLGKEQNLIITSLKKLREGDLDIHTKIDKDSRSKRYLYKHRKWI